MVGSHILRAYQSLVSVFIINSQTAMMITFITISDILDVHHLGSLAIMRDIVNTCVPSIFGTIDEYLFVTDKLRKAPGCRFRVLLFAPSS